MKKLASIFLVCIVLLQCSTKVAIVAWYYLNKDFIAANLCENKAKPQLKCEGKCLLTKKMKEHGKGESELPNLLKQVTEAPLFLSSICVSFESTQYAIPIIDHKSLYSFTYSSVFKGSIFQPPKYSFS